MKVKTFIKLIAIFSAVGKVKTFPQESLQEKVFLRIPGYLQSATFFVFGKKETKASFNDKMFNILINWF